MENLSKQREEILEKIVGFGGYITKNILHLYKSSITLDGCYRILLELEEMKYIKRIDYFRSPREPTVFQVTKKACRLYGREESYMRKKHQPQLIRRYLIRSHFLFYLAGKHKMNNLFSSVCREEFLLSQGIEKELMPKKIDKNTVTIHIEEYISLLEKRIMFIYIDNPSRDINKQIEQLFSKYKRMIMHCNANNIDIGYYIVTEDAIRAMNYDNEIKESKLKEKIRVIIVNISKKYAKN